jgi:hypothetical protein
VPLGIILALSVAWFLWIWLRSARRYAGPAEGPGWEPRRPACERCGYVLTGLTTADGCPECGQAISESLPDHRRPTAYAASGGFARIPAFFRTAIGILLGRPSFRNLTILDAHSAARSFAIGSCLLASGTAAAISLPGIMFYYHKDGRIPLEGIAEWVTVFVLIWMLAFTAFVLLTGAVALLVSGFGFRPLQSRATVVFYSSIWLLPVAAMGIATAAGYIAVVEGYTIFERTSLGALWHRYSSDSPRRPFIFVPAILLGLTILFAGVHARAALRAIRFANR